jgi:hypothetical protein
LRSRRETNGKITKREKPQPKAKGQSEGNLKRENADQTYDGCYSLCTAEESQATADSRKRKDLNERQKDVLKGT